MPKTYICKETFQVDKYDDGGRYEADELTIEAGAMFKVCETTSRLVGGLDTVRLEGITADEGTWLEIGWDTLAEYFAEFQPWHGGNS